MCSSRPTGRDSLVDQPIKKILPLSVISFYKRSNEILAMSAAKRKSKGVSLPAGSGNSEKIVVKKEPEVVVKKKKPNRSVPEPLSEKTQSSQNKETLRRSSRRKSTVKLKAPKNEVKEEIVPSGIEEEEDDATKVKIESKADILSDEGDGELSYEQQRLKNIAENAKFFASLGIVQAKSNLKGLAPTKFTPVIRGLKCEQKKPKFVPPRSPSLRLQGKTPDGEQLPDLPRRPDYFNPEPIEERHERQLPTVKMKAMNVKKEGIEGEGESFIKGMIGLSMDTKESAQGTSKECASLLKRLQKLNVMQTTVAKVVPNRVFSLAVHPTETKTIIAAGGKWGKLGFWDVDSTEGDDGVFLFDPHNRPINCLKFCPSCPTKVFTSAYDGTLRKGDFEKGLFEEVYCTPEEDDILIHSFDFLSRSGDEILTTHGDGTGYVAIVDTRTASVVDEQLYKLHKKNIRTVMVHPTNKNYFVTASVDGYAALWDIRSLKKSQSNSISVMPHGKMVSSAYFSPITGSKILTTSSDDKLRMYSVQGSGEVIKSAQLSANMYHNNNTGRWLTKFRANWHPQSDEMFVVGSMQRPRRIELYDDKFALLHEFMNELYLGSVCSLNSFHPTKDIVVGANSSGRLHLFR